MDGLSVAASVIAVVDISAKVASLCFQYSVAVKDAKRDIERLQKMVTDIKNVLEGIGRLLDKQDESSLSTIRKLDSLKEYQQQLQGLRAELEPSKGRKAMQRVGFRALKWPFTSKQVEKLVDSLEQYGHTFSLALQVDQVEVILTVDRKLDLVGHKIDMAKLRTAEGASFDSHMEEHNSTCLPNTRTELLRHIEEWANDKNGKTIFWLNGAAGTGKSTIARTVARTFDCQQKLGASFFFKRGEGERGKASRFFTTIATQLACVSEIGPEIKKAIDAYPAISEKALKDQFEKLIFQPLSEAHLPVWLLVVIDALDECEHHDDIREILNLLARTKYLEGVSLRVFVTSRPELHIRLGFKQMADGTYEDLVLNMVANETVGQDIRIYIEHELTKIRKERDLPLDWPGEESIQMLVFMAVPLFIFAATVCRFVGETSGNPRRRLEDILRYESEDVSKLDITYLPILDPLFATQNRKEKEKLSIEFQEIVGTIVVLETPLSINSLTRLLGRTKDDISCRLDTLHSVLSIPDSKDEPVRLFHLSFRDFLMDPLKKDSPFWVDERAGHERLAFLCIKLMSRPDGLRHNMYSLEPGILKNEIDERKITSHMSPELQYACRYWVHHLEQSQHHISDGDPTDIFLQKHLLHWLEVMGLIGEIDGCCSLIYTLIALTDPQNSVLSLFLQDAIQFTSKFWSILRDAPLQIYSSTFIFAPEASIIRKAFADEILVRIEMLSKRKGDGDASHSHTVHRVAFSPDGKLVASTSNDLTVRVWETATGSCCSVLEGHLWRITAMAFSLDGKLVASASDDSTVRVWEVATGSCCSVLHGHRKTINAVVFSPDGKLVASASDDKTARVWEVATGRLSVTKNGIPGSGVAWASGLFEVPSPGSRGPVLKGHSGSINAIAFSPDGKLVASASDDGTVRVWEVATRSCCSVLEGHSNTVNAVTFSPDGKLVASASDDSTVRVWEAATGSCCSVIKGHSGAIKTVAFSPDGQCLHTDQGDTPLPLSSTTSPSLEMKRSFHLSKHNGWAFISLNQQRLMWFPSGSPPSCFAVYEDVVCVGHYSGCITLLKVNRVPALLPT